MSKKYLDLDGVSHFLTKLKALFVSKESGKGLSTNDYTTSEKNKLAGITANAQPNVLEGVQVNGDTITPTNKIANIPVPTATSDLTNDSNFVSDNSYVHTDNNYTTTEKNKLAGLNNYVLPNASSNTLGGIKVGDGLSIDNNGVLSADVSGDIPTKTSDLENDSGFITSADLPTKVSDLTNDSGFQNATQVNAAIDSKIGSTYKAKGSVAFASLPSLTSSNEGNVYNVTDAFTTTSDFVEGAGKKHPAGTNVVIVNTTGSTYKYDVLAGFVDLSDYQLSADLVAITNNEIDALFS